jgi:hypothetical protein
MENKKFNLLLSDAYRQLDELSKLVKDTIKSEELIIDKGLTVPADVIPPVLPFVVNVVLQSLRGTEFMAKDKRVNDVTLFANCVTLCRHNGLTFVR